MDPSIEQKIIKILISCITDSNSEVQNLAIKQYVTFSRLDVHLTIQANRDWKSLSDIDHLKIDSRHL